MLQRTLILAFNVYQFTKVYTFLDIIYGIILLLYMYCAEGLPMKPDGGL